VNVRALFQARCEFGDLTEAGDATRFGTATRPYCLSKTAWERAKVRLKARRPECCGFRHPTPQSPSNRRCSDTRKNPPFSAPASRGAT
jgi:hypothetical protein